MTDSQDRKVIESGDRHHDEYGLSLKTCKSGNGEITDVDTVDSKCRDDVIQNFQRLVNSCQSRQLLDDTMKHPHISKYQSSAHLYTGLGPVGLKGGARAL